VVPENEHCKHGNTRMCDTDSDFNNKTTLANETRLTLERISTEARTGLTKQAPHETVVAFVSHRVVPSAEDDASGLVQEGKLLQLDRPELIARRHVRRQRVTVSNHGRDLPSCLGHVEAMGVVNFELCLECLL